MSNIILWGLVALVVLFILVRLMGKKSSNVSQNEVQTGADAPQTSATAYNEIQGEVLAAISMALNEAQDTGQNILTFKQVNKNYSPWNSKIYNMRELPRK